MAAFDLKQTLRQISPDLRQQLFSSWPSLAAIDWKQVRKKRCVDPLFDELQNLSADEKRSIHFLLRTMVGLASACGLKVLIDELAHSHPNLVAAWSEVKTKLDKVVWTYLNAKDVFEEAIIFARADRLSKQMYWKKWTGVSCNRFARTPERIEALRQSLVEHHSAELRGEQCEIHPYTRLNGAEYFFAYLPDWPDNFMVFNREGQLEALDLPTAFSILFVFTPATGVLEIIAAGGQATLASLRRRFYKAMTNTDVEDSDPDRPAFELDHVLADGFAFTGHDTMMVERVNVTRLLVYPRVEGFNVEGLQLRFRRGTPWSKIIERLDQMLSSIDLTRAQVTVEEIWIRAQCVGNGNRRGRTIPIDVTPRASSLKSIEEDDLRVIGEKCVKAWRIDRD